MEALWRDTRLQEREENINQFADGETIAEGVDRHGRCVLIRISRLMIARSVDG